MRSWGSQRGVVGLAVLVVAVFVCSLSASPAAAGVPKLKAVKDYPGLTTFQCRTGRDPDLPRPEHERLRRHADLPATRPRSAAPASVDEFADGFGHEGYITRFKPSMLEVHGDGSTTTPAVWDLHLHHVVWIAPGGGPTFASGEEKTIAKMPQRLRPQGRRRRNWGINQMLHNLGASEGRSVYLTWEIDWVPSRCRRPESSR